LLNGLEASVQQGGFIEALVGAVEAVLLQNVGQIALVLCDAGEVDVGAAPQDLCGVLCEALADVVSVADVGDQDDRAARRRARAPQSLADGAREVRQGSAARGTQNRATPAYGAHA
jgi:hypothetical protein